MLPLRSSLIAVCTVLALCACASQPSAQTGATSSNDSASSTAYDPNHLPAGSLGQQIRLGHDIFADPKKYLPNDVSADMSCSACHIAEGTVKRGGTLVGVYARFPQWNKRAKRVIAVQDRLAECFLYSMNGTPPAYTSKEMIAMTAYVAYLSRKVPVGTPRSDSDRFFVASLPAGSPDLKAGQALYQQKCSLCHQANGAGVHGKFPPLWGPTSFNKGAGMANVHQMTGFVHYNMPANAPGTLSMQDAYNVSAWILSHERPAFDAKKLVSFPPLPAKFF